MDSSYKQAATFHQRLIYLLNIPQSFRTMQNIYLGIQQNSSSVYKDRISAYASIVFLMTY